jgi:hypothetical protein
MHACISDWHAEKMRAQENMYAMSFCHLLHARPWRRDLWRRVGAIIRDTEVSRLRHVICHGNFEFDARRHGLWRRDVLPRRRELWR